MQIEIIMAKLFEYFPTILSLYVRGTRIIHKN